MTSEQIDYMTQSGMLFLDKKRRKSHFDAAYTFRLYALIPLGLFLYFIIKYGFARLSTGLTICVVMASVLLLVSYLIFMNQQSKLKLTSVNTAFPKEDNYALAIKALKVLQWTIKEDTPDFIESYNPHNDFRTWGNEMVSIVLLDNQILLNSICNLDRINQAFFTLGKNKQNVDKFIETFELIAEKKVQQSA